jgi:hypothetical protein
MDEREISKSRFIIGMLAIREQVLRDGLYRRADPDDVRIKMAEIESTLTAVDIAEHNDIKVRFRESEDGELFYEMSDKGQMGFVPENRPLTKIESKIPNLLEIREKTKEEKLSELSYEIAVLTNISTSGVDMTNPDTKREIDKKLEELKKEMEDLM